MLRQFGDQAQQALRKSTSPAKELRWCRRPAPEEDRAHAAQVFLDLRLARTVVPVRSTVQSMSAKPGAVAAATAFPLRKKSCPVNFGMVCDSTSTISRPFESVARARGGHITGRAGESSGMAVCASERGAEASCRLFLRRLTNHDGAIGARQNLRATACTASGVTP